MEIQDVFGEPGVFHVSRACGGGRGGACCSHEGTFVYHPSFLWWEECGTGSMVVWSGSKGMGGMNDWGDYGIERTS